jgi:putative methyltransferase (TIGR04325 family)
MEIRKFVPPIVKEIYKKKLSQYGWFGDYPSWDAAAQASGGYDSKKILLKVKESLLKVKRGHAIYERDSVLFDKKEYSPVILAGLLLARERDSLSVIDFGGSLGTTYFQNKGILDKIKKVSWNIIEQRNFVECGKKYFQDEKLKFYEDFGQCLKKEQPNILILSNVLQYLENPKEFVKEILNMGFEYILIDRTPVVKGCDRLTVQKVNPKIYEASYPCWFFNEDSLISHFLGRYDLVEEFNCPDNSNIPSEFKGFILKKK